jgi:hypothetical protein
VTIKKILFPILIVLSSVGLEGCQRKESLLEQTNGSKLEVEVLELTYFLQGNDEVARAVTPREGAIVFLYREGDPISTTTDPQGKAFFSGISPSPENPVTVVVLGEGGRMAGVANLPLSAVTLYYPREESAMITLDPGRIAQGAGTLQGTIERWTPYRPPGTIQHARIYAQNLSQTVLLSSEGKRSAFLSTDPPPQVRRCIAPVTLEAEGDRAITFQAEVDRSLSEDSGDSIKIFPAGGVTIPGIEGDLPVSGIYTLTAWLRTNRNDLDSPLFTLSVLSGSTPLTQGVSPAPARLDRSSRNFVTTDTFLPFSLDFFWDGVSSVTVELLRNDTDMTIELWVDRFEIAPADLCQTIEDLYLGPSGFRFPVPEGRVEVGMVEFLVDEATGRVKEILSLDHSPGIEVPRGVTQTISLTPRIRPDPSLCSSNPEGQLALHLVGLERKYYTPAYLQDLTLSLSLRSPLGLELPLFHQTGITFSELEQGETITDQVFYLPYPFALTGELSDFFYRYEVRMRFEKESPFGVPITVESRISPDLSLTHPCNLVAPLALPHADPVTTLTNAKGAITIGWSGSPELSRLILSSSGGSLTLYPFPGNNRTVAIPLSWIRTSPEPIQISLESFDLAQPLKSDREMALNALILSARRPFWRRLWTFAP